MIRDNGLLSWTQVSWAYKLLVLGIMKMTDAYIGFGANIGDSVQQIFDAKQQLLIRSGCVEPELSAFYLSSPVGYSDQPYFVNAVLRCSVSISSIELLNLMQAIEVDLGRVRDANNRNAPRTIDLDILLYGNQVIESPRLVVPHPRMFERRFVLEPLREVLNDNHALRRSVIESCYALRNCNDQILHPIQC